MGGQADGAASRGIERGARRTDADVTLTLELLAGPLFYRYLWLGEPVDERYVRAVAAAVLDHPTLGVPTQDG